MQVMRTQSDGGAKIELYRPETEKIFTGIIPGRVGIQLDKPGLAGQPYGGAELDKIVRRSGSRPAEQRAGGGGRNG